MENKNLNEVKDLNENEFEKVSGGMNKNTKSVKLRDDEVIESYPQDKILENVDGGKDGYFYI